MATTVLVGVQWGDEGKGKIIDVLTENAEMVIRFQGGNNAGHTVEIGKEKFVLHLVPSGIFRDGARCVIGNGVVVDPISLTEEIAELEARGVVIGDRLELSSRCHLILRYHRMMDKLRESSRGKSGPKIGTTGRGIGPAYSDKASRRGIRAVDMLDLERFEKRFRFEAEYYNRLFRGAKHETVDIDAEWAALKTVALKLAPYVTDTALSVNRAVKAGKSILFEGAQGMMLDVDFGTYPFVTSSNTTSGGACVGSGLSPKYIDEIYGVMKAYTTRVGEGPFPTELFDAVGERLREIGREFGATTGRPRRCGWFDAVSARYSCLINGVDKLAITKLDVLDEFETLNVCVAYEYQGRRYEDMPADTDALIGAKPIYETLPGWRTPTREARRFADLPEKAQAYLRRISSLVDAKIGLVSVGPNRDQTFYA